MTHRKPFLVVAIENTKTLCTYVRSVSPKRRHIRKLMTGRPYIWRLKIKTSEIRKLFDCGQKSFHEIMLLGTVKQVDGTMGKYTIPIQVTWNEKVGRCYL